MSSQEIKELAKIADQLLNDNKIVEAANAYARLAEVDKTNADAFLTLGELQGEMGQLEIGLKNIQHSLELDPDVSYAWLSLAYLLQAKGDIELSIRSALKAVELEYELLDAWIFLGAIAGQSGKLREAENCGWRAICLNPDNSDVYVNYANTLYQQSKLEEAEEAYLAALKIKPSHQQALSGLIILLFTQEKIEEVISALSKVTDLPLSVAQTYVSMGADLLEKNAKLAVKLFNRISEICPAYSDAILNKSKALIKLELYNDAVVSLEQVLQLSPRSLEARHLLGEAKSRL